MALAHDAYEIKRISREIGNKTDVLPPENNEFSINCMTKALRAKFSIPKLRSYLMQTTDKILVEANPGDRYWSCGLAKENKRIANQEHWLGENKLGELLMDLRREMVRDQ